MALRTLWFLLLWGLSLAHHCDESPCNVTCSTDYDVLLNCSCSGSVPRSPVLVQVSCSDGYEEVSGSCEVLPPGSWCLIHVHNLYDVASVGTNCSSTASRPGRGTGVRPRGCESPPWALSDVVKAQPPFHVRVSLTNGFYNISWATRNQMDCLTYRVRVRETRDLSKAPVHLLLMEMRYLQLDHDRLQPHVGYMVDVQAQMCPENIYRGPWSEWSPTTEWRTTGPAAEQEGIFGYEWMITLTCLVIFLILLFGFTNHFWQNLFQRLTYIPKPNVFFKPLDRDYNGNFKEWVKPTFSEHDYELRTEFHGPPIIKKQLDVLPWSRDEQGHREDSEANDRGHVLDVEQIQEKWLLQLQDNDEGSEATGHSIHTVILSGEDSEEEGMLQSSLASYQGEGSLGSFEEDKREHLETADLHGQCGIFPQDGRQVPCVVLMERINMEPQAQFDDPERLSLDSFVSNEQSEDNYPNVDLDTIDSGFMECSSPGPSDSDVGTKANTGLFHEHKNSNYVKQWMICNTIQKDPNNGGNELSGTK